LTFDLPVYDIPPIYDHTAHRTPLIKENSLRQFLQSFLGLLKNEKAIEELKSLLGNYEGDKGELVP